MYFCCVRQLISRMMSQSRACCFKLRSGWSDGCSLQTSARACWFFTSSHMASDFVCVLLWPSKHTPVLLLLLQQQVRVIVPPVSHSTGDREGLLLLRVKICTESMCNTVANPFTISCACRHPSSTQLFGRTRTAARSNVHNWAWASSNPRAQFIPALSTVV